jgi:hypothetical protein
MKISRRALMVVMATGACGVVTSAQKPAEKDQTSKVTLIVQGMT